MISRLIFVCAVASACAIGGYGQKWPKALAPAFPEADPYVAIPNAAIAPSATTSFSAVFDATKFPSDRKTILPALNAVGGLMNDLPLAGRPPKRCTSSSSFTELQPTAFSTTCITSRCMVSTIRIWRCSQR